jgi:hypothetical protein
MRTQDLIEEDYDIDCAEQYEHGCNDCPDYDCPFRDFLWTDPYDEELKKAEAAES